MKIIGYSKNDTEYEIKVDLIQKNKPLYYATRMNNKVISDIVAIPVKDTQNLKFVPFTLDMQNVVRIGEDIVIIGFAENEGLKPSIVRGKIISAPGGKLVANGVSMDIICIDQVTRQGMSGSPVLQIANNKNFVLVGIHGASGANLSCFWDTKYLYRLMQGVP